MNSPSLELGMRLRGGMQASGAERGSNADGGGSAVGSGSSDGDLGRPRAAASDPAAAVLPIRWRA